MENDAHSVNPLKDVFDPLLLLGTTPRNKSSFPSTLRRSVDPILAFPILSVLVTVVSIILVAAGQDNESIFDPLNEKTDESTLSLFQSLLFLSYPLFQTAIKAVDALKEDDAESYNGIKFHSPRQDLQNKEILSPHMCAMILWFMACFFFMRMLN
jgi:hypothetical protein